MLLLLWQIQAPSHNLEISSTNDLANNDVGDNNYGASYDRKYGRAHSEAILSKDTIGPTAVNSAQQHNNPLLH